jgi:hypothetical protein
MRFYLTRAKLFRQWAIQGASEEQKKWCAHYCVADAAATIRLAGDRRGWVERAELVLHGLPAALQCGCHLCAPVYKQHSDSSRMSQYVPPVPDVTPGAGDDCLVPDVTTPWHGKRINTG